MRDDIAQFVHCKYSRYDVDYSTWYTAGMRHIAATLTPTEIVEKLQGADKSVKTAASSHLRAIQRSGSMQSQSQARAQTGNTVSLHSNEVSTLKGALEIYWLFPEFTKLGSEWEAAQ